MRMALDARPCPGSRGRSRGSPIGGDPPRAPVAIGQIEYFPGQIYPKARHGFRELGTPRQCQVCFRTHLPRQPRTLRPRARGH